VSGANTPSFPGLVLVEPGKLCGLQRRQVIWRRVMMSYTCTIVIVRDVRKCDYGHSFYFFYCLLYSLFGFRVLTLF
jgi:hypothetical protein